MRPDWVDSYIAATENITSPLLFRKWAAISTIAGALERKVWVHTKGSNLYPNMYTVLVGPPGVGKTEVTWRTREFWGALEDHYIASTSVTKASLIDELAESNRRIITNVPENPVSHFNSLLLCINELGVLIPAYENEFMNTLTDLWDCKRYSERRRTSKIEIDIERTQLNLLAACTPSYLMHVLPEGAWDQGFLSRTMLVYSGNIEIRSLFASTTTDQKLVDILTAHLKNISTLYGEMSFTPEAAQAADHFNMTGGEPKPDHPKLLSYNIRRVVHMLKLAMVASVSRSDEMLITVEDVERALEWLFEVESSMPDIFKAMSQGGTGKVMEEAWHFIFKAHAKEQKAVKEHRLIQFLQERVPVHNIKPTIDMMVQGKMIEKKLEVGGVGYVPRGRQGPQ